MQTISKIAHNALLKLSNGEYVNLEKLAINGLLNDFHYSWNERLDIPYNLDAINIARSLCCGHDESITKISKIDNIEEIRVFFSRIIYKEHKNDTRVLLKLHYNDGKIDTEWLPKSEYLEDIEK